MPQGFEALVDELEGKGKALRAVQLRDQVGLIRFAPQFGMSDESYAKVMNANLRLMKKLGRP